MKRRKFLSSLTNLTLLIISGSVVKTTLRGAVETYLTDTAGAKKRFTMGIQTQKCIGCGRCVTACKTENNVPEEPFYFRTWVEHYVVKKDDSVIVHSINGGSGEISENIKEHDVLRSFFVPKLCNHCENPPCVQVCPVGATFKTEDGIVLVDEDRCIGCSYCLQACPYGARYIRPATHIADKCTLCYHRIKKGLNPVCVEVCPTQARVFGDLESGASPLVRLKRMKNTHVLKPALNTEPKVFYTDLDGAVK
ncbi:MAG: 4Fe-4S dicluster domain-containing protein [Fidelibacterota bacterium]|nr:MAG: 4Fe-4S dicluster domain-containing protein [Candidatus Neomarinimicrobiota bacterium]